MSRTGLVLTGGGARGAYQAGALRAMAEITGARPSPFPIVTGVSAGAINAAVLATDAGVELRIPAERLWATWRTIRADNVFRTDALSFLGLGTRWLRDLSLGGLLGSTKATHLLDTAPLRHLLSSRVDCARIRAHVDAGRLYGFAVSATNYMSGTAVTFFDGDPALEPWQRSLRIAVRARIEVEHILASSAIPILFPPVRLSGSHYGDGCVRLGAPLSPAIHLGADRVVAIGIRFPRPPQAAVALSAEEHRERLSLVDIAGVLLNAVFLDSLETDVERLERINRTVGLLDHEKRAAHPDRLRAIPALVIRPSQDLGKLAHEQFHRFPRALRHMLRGIGASDEKGWDLLSYLAFDEAYTGRLLDLGYADVMARRDEVAAFLDA